MTQRTDMAEERSLRPDREAQHQSALAVLNTEPRLALLGDPGSGKSTFIRFACRSVHGGEDCVTILTPICTCSPLRCLRMTAPHATVGREKPQPQPWDHGALLPLRVVLREFVARGLPHTSQPATVLSDSLWHFIIAELPEMLRPFEPSLRQQLLRLGGLLLLDGLDEVPEADDAGAGQDRGGAVRRGLS